MAGARGDVLAGRGAAAENSGGRGPPSLIPPETLRAAATSSTLPSPLLRPSGPRPRAHPRPHPRTHHPQTPRDAAPSSTLPSPLLWPSGPRPHAHTHTHTHTHTHAHTHTHRH